MNKIKQLANKLYNQQILDGWKNVSMKDCFKKAKSIEITKNKSNAEL